MSKPDTKPVKRIAPDASIIDQAIATLTGAGWYVTSRTDSAVQLCKPKSWSAPLLAIGTVGFIFGFGIIFLVLAILDYMLQSDKTLFLSADYIRQNGIRVPRQYGELVLLGIGILISVASCGFVFLALAS